jgi:hypothetical protein
MGVRIIMNLPIYNFPDFVGLTLRRSTARKQAAN